ncbi:MAG TPA: ATP-dependent Clp protease adapter ClpS [Egibacteraceae bacterium]|nr:ATP-dependent Clp protease adapter ClpS [Egibacteraceae bacterium]
MSASAPTTAPQRTDDPVGEETTERDRPWNVIVWNDPVTLMSYVVYVLRKLFGHDEPTATKLMLQVHHEGKAVVASGPRERSEYHVARLHAHGLQATLAQD